MMSQLYDPLTSSVESDSDLDTSVLDVSAASDKTTPSDITSRRVQMAGRQECAWPVPTPPSRDKLKAPRGYSRRTRVVKANSWTM
ncbi:hypothetical protein KOW79_000502 [Hemibagrus wyckioides]|uniref:Uncharacterized protein n=1 Tax=Hemibagrus wyckioides TaxID=337641 RepID=A0A9D3SY54_9TELE|nr:hypothetical protein KOW79_000502 [Hemibagrus wyckioides]